MLWLNKFFLLQPQCIKCCILKAQWLPGLLLINVQQRLTIMLNSISMNLYLPYLKIQGISCGLESGHLVSDFSAVRALLDLSLNFRIVYSCDGLVRVYVHHLYSVLLCAVYFSKCGDLTRYNWICTSFADCPCYHVVSLAMFCGIIVNNVTLPHFILAMSLSSKGFLHWRIMTKNHPCDENINFWRNLMKFNRIARFKLQNSRFLLFCRESGSISVNCYHSCR